MATTQELACVYSALILQDNDKDVSADKLKTLLQAAKVEVEPVFISVFSKAASALPVNDFVSNIGSGAGAGPVDGAADAGAADSKAEAKEEKKEEEEESDEDMGFGLFD